MALVAFLRGVNVGGHRTFRPAQLARELGDFGVVNIGAAGTFVVRRPGSAARFRAAITRRLPFAAEMMLCQGRDLIELAELNPYGTAPAAADLVRFVCILSARPSRDIVPITLPDDGPWLVRVSYAHGRFLCGEYRRHMRTIHWLGELDRRFGARATTRNWNTIAAVLKALGRE